MSRFAWIAAAACLAWVAPAAAQTAQEGRNLGALSPENLAKPRPKAPFDLTGTWNMVIDQANGAYAFRPVPKLTPAAAAEAAKFESYAKKGLVYRDDSAACWPLGMPAMMTRYWPVQIIQLPTMVQITAMFFNTTRWIYTDGRAHPPEDEIVFTYNGHSTGQWDGDTLVVDTVGMTGDHHWIHEGVPAGDKLHIVERYRMAGDGKAFEIEFVMTDPDHWQGEWRNTKKFVRQDRTDIEEHVCIFEQMQALPSFKSNVRK